MKIKFSIKSLKILSISYLAIPIVLFFIFWLKPIIAVLLLFLLGYSFIKFIKNEQKNVIVNWPILQFLLIILLVTIWVFISGAGGWGFQSPDLSKHSSIYKDIITQGTPTSYIFGNKTIHLAAYLAYYIPIPLVFGGFEWQTMMFLVTIWTFLGAFIGITWFLVLINSFSIRWVLFFILVGGLDFAGLVHNIGIGDALKTVFTNFYNTLPFFSIQIDPKMLLLYEGNSHSLFWGPQHALPCWIATGLFFYEYFYENNIKKSPIYLVLIPFWSPFILLGIAPFILIKLFEGDIKKYFSSQNLALIPVFATIIWFVNSVPVAELDKGLIFYKPDRLLNYLQEIKAYFFFLFFEVIVWLTAVYIFLKYEKTANFDKEKYLKILFQVAIILCLIPIYKLGKWNDFVQRVSMPALFILWVLVAIAWQKTKKLYLKIIFTLLFFIGSWDSAYHILFSLKVTDYKLKYTAVSPEKVTNFVETSIKEKWPIEQSFAPDSASFFRYMVRK